MIFFIMLTAEHQGFTFFKTAPSSFFDIVLQQSGRIYFWRVFPCFELHFKLLFTINDAVNLFLLDADSKVYEVVYHDINDVGPAVGITV